MDRDKIIGKLENSKVEDLYSLLKELKGLFDRSFAEELNRSLPFADLLFDRWKRAEALGFGKGTSIYDSSIVIGAVSVGEHTWIGPHTVLDGSGGLQIGSYCSVSAGVQIYSHDSVRWAVSGGLEDYEYSATTIGNNCYIGPNSIISKGVSLGNGCIVGANSFVNKSFPDHSKIAGSPARVIG